MAVKLFIRETKKLYGTIKLICITVGVFFNLL